ncbi:MAG: NHLP bacteriocin system secretion protein [Thermodesulfobacteriota bacterium]
MPGEPKPATISSPEQLDQMLRVASPGGWIALVALGLILAAALAWGFWGSIPTKVDGAGMLIRASGVMDVVSLGQGQLWELKVDSGSQVDKGQLVAVVAQPEVQAQIDNAARELEQYQKQESRLREFYAKQDELQARLYQQQQDNIKASIQNLQTRMAWLRERISAQEALLDKGLITSQTLMQTKESLSSAQEDERNYRAKQKDLEEQALKDKAQQERELFQARLQILETQGRLDLLRSQMQVRSQVVSEQAGRVLEIKARVGAEVNAGTPLFSLELLDRELVAVAYVPAAQGKRIQPKMRIEITPSTVKRDEYGFMLGVVSEVSPFPATEQGMMSLLQNQELVREFSAQGAPIAVRADLIEDASAYSGYKWSSRKGPPQKLFSGTVCTVQVVVEEQPPIQLVIPYFKSLLGL